MHSRCDNLANDSSLPPRGQLEEDTAGFGTTLTGLSWVHGPSGRPWNSSKEVWFFADCGCRWCNLTGPRITTNVVLKGYRYNEFAS